MPQCTFPDATPENRAEKCGMDWIFFKNACYKLSTNQMIWSQARKKCEEGGANLLSINSVDEMVNKIFFNKNDC